MKNKINTEDSISNTTQNVLNDNKINVEDNSNKIIDLSNNNKINIKDNTNNAIQDLLNEININTIESCNLNDKIRFVEKFIQTFIPKTVTPKRLEHDIKQILARKDNLKQSKLLMHHVIK